MKKLLPLIFVFAVLHCSSRKDQVYPDNGTVSYIDMSAGSPGGALDTTGVEMHYRGSLKDSIEVLQLVEASAAQESGGKKAALAELQKQAQKLGADGIYDVQVKDDGKKAEASGYAFRFRR